MTGAGASAPGSHVRNPLFFCTSRTLCPTALITAPGNTHSMHITPFVADLPDTGRLACPHKRPAQKCGDEPARKSRHISLQNLTKEDSTLPTVARAAQFANLPYEMVRHIAKRLDVRSIGALSQTSHHFYKGLQGMVIERMARHYYGLPDSESRRQYGQLCRPLARRLFADTELGRQRPQHSPAAADALPLCEFQKQWPCQVARLRILSHNGHLQPTCEVAEGAHKFTPLTCGYSKMWGACAVLRADAIGYGSARLVILTLTPSLSCITIPATAPRCSVYRARLLAQGEIVMEGSVHPIGQELNHHVLTVCRLGPCGKVTHELLPGKHSQNIVEFEQLADGRIVSASLDGTLKIRPLSRSSEQPAQVITLSHNDFPITDMALFAEDRCLTSAYDDTFKIWDLSRPTEERCVATLTDNVGVLTELYRLTGNRFLTKSYPNVLMLWQLTDNGALCIARIDPHLPAPLSAPEEQTGREAQHPIPAPCPGINRCTLQLKVLPNFRLLVRNCQGMCLFDLTDRHSASNSDNKGSGHNSDSDVQNSRLRPAGLLLSTAIADFDSVALLPDGRLVHGSADGNIRAYSLTNPNGCKGITLGNFFSGQEHMKHEHPAACHRFIAWMTVMGDGHLLAAGETDPPVRRGPKSLFFVYDPYAGSGSPGSPSQESPDAPSGSSHNPMQED